MLSLYLIFLIFVINLLSNSFFSKHSSFPPLSSPQFSFILFQSFVHFISSFKQPAFGFIMSVDFLFQLYCFFVIYFVIHFLLLPLGFLR